MSPYNVCASVVGLIEADSEADAIAKLRTILNRANLDFHVDQSAGWREPNAFESEPLG